MSFPDIHSCIKLTSEYEDLKKKYIKVKQQRDSYQSELEKYREKAQLENLLKNYVTTRDTFVQTEPVRSWSHQGVFLQPRKKDEKSHVNSEVDKTNKLLSMHNQLMRRYEKEVKNNLTHIETITELNLRISDLEKKLKEEKDTVQKLEKDIWNEQTRRSRSSSRGRQGRSTSRGREGKPRERSKSPKVGKNESSTHLSLLRKECDKLKKENKKLKEELKGLDFGFFEEIEDIKYALQQSAILNKEYEKTIKKLCMQLGVPCPSFGKINNKQT